MVWRLCPLNPKLAEAYTWTKFWRALLMLKPKKCAFLRKCIFCIVGYNSLKQGCGARAKFKPSVPGIQSFWLEFRLQIDLVHWKLKTNTLIVQLYYTNKDKRRRNMIYLMNSGKCAKTFENLWSTQTNLGVGRIYSRGDKGGFLQVLAKAFFKGQTTIKFSFHKFETKKKIFSNFKIRGPVQDPQAPPSNNHENEDICKRRTNHARPAIS